MFCIFNKKKIAFALQVSGNTPIWADNGIFDGNEILDKF
jgi:hypothetical protein